MIGVKMISVYTAAVVLLLSVAAFSGLAVAQEPLGTLKLTLTDAVTGEPTPARIEIRDEFAAYHVAEDALLFGGDCDMSDQGAGYSDLASTLESFTDRLENPYSTSTQFYSDGTSSVRLPEGPVTISVFKGPEYRVALAEIGITAGETVEHEIELKRWINMPDKGWYSADDHLHIPRPDPGLNPFILKMMQAEDIHVANLLQMGKVRNFKIAPQYAHGRESHYQQGHFILAAGQENPRTHFLGHTITLGASKALYNPDEYLIYRLIWEEAVKLGGINGFAHAFVPNGNLVAPHDGMAVVLPHDLLHFVEVLQFNRGGYDTWYDILGLGFRVTPTAGTDYPCADQNIPGHERFYTRVEGDLTYEKWLDGVRNGRTFVTTGPMVEFRVNGEDIGSDIVLEHVAIVEIEGAAHFNPKRDDLAFLELLQNGNVIGRFSRVEGASKIEFRVNQLVNETSWFAVRGYGTELNLGAGASPFHFADFNPTSNVHSAPIYVSLKHGAAIEKSVQSRNVARSWLARLEDLETMLTETNLAQLAQRLETPNFDAVPEDVLRKNRSAILDEIEEAKGFFETLSNQ